MIRPDRRPQLHRNVNEPECQRALPDCSHPILQSRVSTLQRVLRANQMPSCILSIVTPDAKKPREARLFVSEWINGSTCLGDVSGLRSFLALNYLEFDFIALSERLE